MNKEKTYKSSIAKRFGKKASGYRKNSKVQSILLDSVGNIIEKHLKPDQRWIDIGSGPGTLISKIPHLPSATTFVCLDIAFESLEMINGYRSEKLKTACVRADGEHLPFKRNRFDAAVIASMLQWASTPELILNEAANVLKEKGILIFSIFTHGTLRELSSAREECGISNPVSFLSEKSSFELISEAGFSLCPETVRNHTHTEFYDSAFHVLKSLSSIGATATTERFLNRKDILKLCKCYESKFSNDAQYVPVTYNAITGCAIRKDL
ncbi:Biotin synthesis protein BioC [Chitinispirillum alkaliphilum]|nr:Biotin synthesis protein BioC [Chitinispirillum alkaliphilum]